MQNDRFEWDDDKAAENFAKHAISFEVACLAFEDPFAVEWLDNREEYGEDRFNILSMVDGRLLFVAYTLRDNRTRIISARGAEPYEQRKYHEENAS